MFHMYAVIQDLWKDIFDKTSPADQNGCQFWTGAHSQSGRVPIMRINKRHYMVAGIWLEAKLQGPVPAGQAVHWTCGDDACIAPDHIVAGPELADTKVIDLTRPYKYRNNRKQGTLTADAVREIRASSLSDYALCHKYGVSHVTIWKARTGKTWGHIK